MSDNNKTFNSHVGVILKQKREKSGVTQSELGKAIGLSRFSVSNIEKGTQALSFFQAFLTAKYLNIAISDFCDDFHVESVFDSPEISKLSQEELRAVKNILGKLGFSKKVIDE